MKTDYATIKIKVKADGEEIIENELFLSDNLWEIFDDLKEWLKEKTDLFEFEVDIF